MLLNFVLTLKGRDGRPFALIDDQSMANTVKKIEDRFCNEPVALASNPWNDLINQWKYIYSS